MNNTASLPGMSIAVVGAGIVGVATALDLAKRGYCVTVYDPSPPGEGGSSYRNAGHIGASDIQPLSTPGIALKGIKLLLQKDTPLRIPGTEKFKLTPWFLKFLATSRGEKFRKACEAMTFLCHSAIDETDAMLTQAGVPEKMTRCGAGFIYDSVGSFEKSQPTWHQKASLGFTSQVMERAEIAQHLPEMNSKFEHGMVSLNWGKVTDPLEIVRGVSDAARSFGVVFEQTRVKKLVPSRQGVQVFTATAQQNFGGVVVAAGVQAKSFAATLGEKLPLVAERGYNLTFPKPGFELKMPLILPDRGLAITQLTEGLRIGGWAEYAVSDERPENKTFYTALARISAEIFPQLNQDGAIAWMGNRPSLPDSVPVISQSLKCNRIYYNCGHGHYGLTHAAISARILGHLVDGGPLPAAYRAYAIDRFN